MSERVFDRLAGEEGARRSAGGVGRHQRPGSLALGRHHEEALLLDLALLAERERPWPLVAPDAPC